MSTPLTNKETNITWHAGNVTREDRQRQMKQRGVVLWMTGLSGSGKSTIASVLEKLLLQEGKVAYRLDGDNIRFGLSKSPNDLKDKAGYVNDVAQRFGIGFSASDRSENNRRIGEVAKLFADAGVIAIASFISPYRKDRDAVRSNMKAGDFVEVYVKASLAAAERRDPKGLYKKARAGEIRGFTGIDDPYEVPEKPEVIVDTETLAPAEAAKEIFDYLQANGYLSA